MIKDFKRNDNDFNIKKTHYQIIDYNYYFKLKKKFKIKI